MHLNNGNLRIELSQICGPCQNGDNSKITPFDISFVALKDFHNCKHIFQQIKSHIFLIVIDIHQLFAQVPYR